MSSMAAITQHQRKICSGHMTSLCLQGCRCCLSKRRLHRAVCSAGGTACYLPASPCGCGVASMGSRPRVSRHWRALWLHTDSRQCTCSTSRAAADKHQRPSGADP
jgi:hypothetical protein